MTPERRAIDAITALMGETMSKHLNIQSCRNARIAIVAAAIRQAEDDALERAARVIECGCDKFHGGACQASANCAKDDQEAIRDLKHKD